MENEHFSEQDWINNIMSTDPLDGDERLSQEDFNDALIEMIFKPAEDLTWVETCLDSVGYFTKELQPMTTERLNKEWRRISGLEVKHTKSKDIELSDLSLAS
jgi:hypothetical protein